MLRHLNLILKLKGQWFESRQKSGEFWVQAFQYNLLSLSYPCKISCHYFSFFTIFPLIQVTSQNFNNSNSHKCTIWTKKCLSNHSTQYILKDYFKIGFHKKYREIPRYQIFWPVSFSPIYIFLPSFNWCLEGLISKGSTRTEPISLNNQHRKVHFN